MYTTPESFMVINMSKLKVAICGFGVVGQAYSQLFPDAVIYDPYTDKVHNGKPVKETTKEQVNECDIALVCVWTAGKTDGELDMSIVEEVVDWLETPLILIKSALYPGTVDRLVAKTGKKIAVSVEFIGEGNYPVHFWKYPDQHDPRKHSMLIVGGEEKTATACAEVMWSRMSPDIKIHITTALEAEITKLVENSYGALKVTFINTLLSLAKKTDTNFIRIHQAWQSDPRTDSMHLRAVSFNKGWASKCWDKDVPALAAYAESVGADDMATLFNVVLALNEKHLNENAVSD